MSLDKYIGIPFKERESSFNGCDCWGLVRLFYENEFNTLLPDFSSEYINTMDTINIPRLAITESKRWQQANTPMFGDVLLYKIYNLPLHVGIYIDKKRMLHVMKGIDSGLERHDSIMWTSRLEGVFRYGKT